MSYANLVEDYFAKEDKANLCVDIVWSAWDKQIECNYQDVITIMATKAQMRIYERYLKFYGASGSTTYLGYEVVVDEWGE